MPWQEFKQLLAGFNPDTPLGRIVSIRSEDNKDVLKHFSDGQRRIRNKWRNKAAKSMSKKEAEAFYESMKQAFLSMTGKDRR